VCENAFFFHAPYTAVIQTRCGASAAVLSTDLSGTACPRIRQGWRLQAAAVGAGLGWASPCGAKLFPLGRVRGDTGVPGQTLKYQRWRGTYWLYFFIVIVMVLSNCIVLFNCLLP